MRQGGAYFGSDVHEDTIGVVLPGREAPVCRGEIGNRGKSPIRGPYSLPGEVESATLARPRNGRVDSAFRQGGAHLPGVG